VCNAVGLGKTIQTGILLSEARSCRDSAPDAGLLSTSLSMDGVRVRPGYGEYHSTGLEAC
jgi:hypothetical protein